MSSEIDLPPGIVSVRARVAAAVKDKPPIARKLVDLAHRLYEIVEDQHGQVFAIPKSAPRVAVPLQGRGALSAQLTLKYYERHGSPPTPTALKGAIDVLEAQAGGCERVSIQVRCAHLKDGLVIDLGDAAGRAVVVRDGGWTVEKSPPPGIFFRRTRMTEAMPKPKRGGRLDALRDLVNVDEAGWDLIRAWLVLAWLPHVPVPILSISGYQGTGKSVLGRALISLVDPSPSALRAGPKGRDLAEWATVAAASRVVGLDNISNINEEFSDALCRAVTGDGHAKRQLYRDEDLIVQSFRRAIVLTSIDPGALRGDLAERLMPLELGTLGRRRRGEQELNRLFEKRRPAILGGLFDLVAKVLAEPVALDRPPRMADAANVMAAVDRALGSKSLDVYNRSQATIVQTVLESDPVAAAVLALARSEPGGWEGTPTQLYNSLTGAAAHAANWPANAQKLSARLKRVSPGLREAHGLAVTRPDRGDHRAIRLRWLNGRKPGESGRSKVRVKWSGS